MHPIIESKRAELAAVCRPFGVRRLEVFGSAARSDFDEARSDIDFLVEFNMDQKYPVLTTYFGLKDALQQLFHRPVDLVSFGAVENPYIQASIDRSRQLVYAA